jgi:hypothetical protein
MGCDFEFAIQLLERGQWRDALTWQFKTCCGGGPMSRAARRAANERGIWGTYGLEICGRATEPPPKRRKPEAESEEEREEQEQQEQVPHLNPDNCLFYSADQVTTVARLAQTEDEAYKYCAKMLEDARTLMELLRTAPPSDTDKGAWCLDDASELIEQAADEAAWRRTVLRLTHAVFVARAAEPGLAAQVCAFLFKEPGVDVRLKWYDDEGTAEVIRDSEGEGRVPDRGRMCVVS